MKFKVVWEVRTAEIEVDGVEDENLVYPDREFVWLDEVFGDELSDDEYYAAQDHGKLSIRDTEILSPVDAAAKELWEEWHPAPSTPAPTPEPIAEELPSQEFPNGQRVKITREWRLLVGGGKDVFTVFALGKSEHCGNERKDFLSLADAMPFFEECCDRAKQNYYTHPAWLARTKASRKDGNQEWGTMFGPHWE